MNRKIPKQLDLEKFRKLKMRIPSSFVILKSLFVKDECN